MSQKGGHAMSDLTVKPVTKSRWGDLEALFEARGGPKYCWCMAWRAIENRTGASNADRKAALLSRVEKRVPIGLLGYVDGEPVAWCSLGPRESFLKLTDGPDDGEENVWSVTCFFVRRDHRKGRLSGRMLDAAMDYARERGAKVIEGYAVDPTSPSYRFMGFVDLFAARDFSPVGRAGKRRHVMRREL